MEENPSQSTISTQYQQPTPDQPMKQKGFLLPIIGAVIVLAIIGLGGYLLYQRQTTSNNQAKVEAGKQILNSKTSPDGNFTVSEEILTDYNKIKITDKSGKVITEDLVAGNEKEIGYNVKFKCQCGTSFKEWADNSHFKLKIVNGGGEEYEFLVNAATGKVDESSFMKVSGPGATANWKAYTNTKFQFSINYPNSWPEPVYDSSSSSIHFSINPSANIPQDKKSYEIAIWIKPYNYDDLYQTLKNHPKYTQPLVGGNQAYRIEKFGLDVPRINTIAVSNTYEYDIELVFNGKDYLNENGFETAKKDFPEAEKTYEQMLSTFKFTNQVQANNTTNWKTYTNTKYGFSFQYPSDYFKYQQEDLNIGIYLAPSQGQGGNGPKFLNSSDVWLNATTLSGANLTSLDEYLNLQDQGDFYKNAQKTQATIGGVLGYKVNYSFPAVAGNVTEYNYEGMVLHNETIYKITISAWSKDVLTSKQALLDQILSTFKFTQ